MNKKGSYKFSLQQYKSLCNSTNPYTTIQIPLQQYKSLCNNTNPSTTIQIPLQEYNYRCRGKYTRVPVNR